MDLGIPGFAYAQFLIPSISTSIPRAMKASQLTQETCEMVRVRFRDPSEFDTRYDNDAQSAVCEAVGWALSPRDDSLRIAWLVDDCPDKWKSGLVIPRGCVLEVKRLKEEKDGK